MASWSAAATEAAGGYDMELVSRFRVARAALRKRTRPPALLALVVRMLARDRLSITDFGGAAGEELRDLLAFFPDVQCTIVEHPALVRLMKADRQIRFTTDVPERCDVFYSSGALQCIEDQQAVLEGAFASARHAVILTRNSFSRSPIYRVQRTQLFNNGSGPIPPGYTNLSVAFAHQTLQEAAVHKTAERFGFACLASFADESGVLSYRGQVYGGQLAFVSCESGLKWPRVSEGMAVLEDTVYEMRNCDEIKGK